MSVNYSDFEFNSIQTGKLLYEITYFDSFIKSQIRNKSVFSIYRLVSYYLYYKEKASLEDIEKILSRYSILILYMYFISIKDSLGQSYHKYLGSEYLDNLLSRPLDKNSLLTINMFKNDQSLFFKLFCNANNLSKTLAKSSEGFLYSRNELYNCITSIEGIDDNNIKILNSILDIHYHYFTTSTDFEILEKYDRKRKMDYLICESIFNNDHYNFSFDIAYSSKDSFISNLNNPKDYNIARVLVGFMMNYAFKNDLLNKKVFDFPFYSTVLKIATCNKDSKIKGVLMFLNEDDNKSNTYESDNYIADLNVIEEFDVIYNDVDYRFSKKGIIKL